MKSNAIWAVILVIMLFYLSQQTPTTPTRTDAIDEEDISLLVDADVAFSGQRRWVDSTRLDTYSVRVLELNGDITNDLGYRPLNLGELNVVPLMNYRLYFFMNDSSPNSTHSPYYVDVQDYTGKNQEAADLVRGYGCAIDTSPTIIIRNQDGGTNKATSAASQAIAAGESKYIEIEIIPHRHKCYGNPGSPRGNAICFNYSTTAFSSVKSETDRVEVPAGLSFYYTDGLSCWEFPLLENQGSTVFTVGLTAASTNPTLAHNISVYLDDITFDLDDNTLEEIWGFGNDNTPTTTNTAQFGDVITGEADKIIRIS